MFLRAVAAEEVNIAVNSLASFSRGRYSSSFKTPMRNNRSSQYWVSSASSCTICILETNSEWDRASTRCAIICSYRGRASNQLLREDLSRQSPRKPVRHLDNPDGKILRPIPQFCRLSHNFPIKNEHSTTNSAISHFPNSTFSWGDQWDSNPRPPGPQPGVLTD